MHRLYCRGDTHSDNVRPFSYRSHKWLRELDDTDTVFILGDYAFEWPGCEKANRYALDFLEGKPWTTVIVRGNHDNADAMNALPDATTEQLDARGMGLRAGEVKVVRPNVFAVPRTAILNCADGRKCVLCIGGAKSHDIDHLLDPQDPDFKERKRYLEKHHHWYRVIGRTWWPDEDIDIAYAESVLGASGADRFDYILTHDCPALMIRVYARDGIARLSPTKGENYLESLRRTLGYRIWCHGHMHTDFYAYGARCVWPESANGGLYRWADIDQHRNVCLYHDIWDIEELGGMLAKERCAMRWRNDFTSY